MRATSRNALYTRAQKMAPGECDRSHGYRISLCHVLLKVLMNTICYTARKNNSVGKFVQCHKVKH